MAVNIPVLFPNDSQLRADELLLYSLMTLTFPIQTKNHASKKYNEIICNFPDNWGEIQQP
jgi:hypothetical protein